MRLGYHEPTASTIRDTIINRGDKSSGWFRVDGVNAALCLAEPVIEKLERQLSNKTADLARLRQAVTVQNETIAKLEADYKSIKAELAAAIPTKAPTPEEAITEAWKDVDLLIYEHRRHIQPALKIADQLLAEKREREKPPVVVPEWPQWFASIGDWMCYVVKWLSPSKSVTYRQDGRVPDNDLWDYVTMALMADKVVGWRRIPEPEWAKEGKEATT